MQEEEKNLQETAITAAEGPKTADEDNTVRTGLDPEDTEYASHPAFYAGAKDEEQGPKRSVIIKYAAAFSSGVLLSVLALLLLTYGLGLFRVIPDPEYKYYRELKEKSGKYYEILKLIDADPIAKKKPSEISDDMFKDMLNGIGDPYAEYYTTEEYEEFMKNYGDDYVGIGIIVSKEKSGIKVVYVIPDGPAHDAGMKADDVIVAIDGKKPRDVDDAVDMISGETGTKVSLTIRRGSESIDMDLTRTVIDQESVAYAEYKDDHSIGVIRIVSFRKGTSDEFEEAVKELQNKGCDKFIIDLRGNGGGITDESIKIADYLLPECRIMTAIAKDGSEKVFNSKAGSAEIDYVVLTDGGTASASEILAGAIQDNKGGLIIGSKTYGKGVTQLSRKFKDGSAIKITSTEYLRPNGGKVNGIGITPDIRTDDEEALEKAIGELTK